MTWITVGAQCVILAIVLLTVRYQRANYRQQVQIKEAVEHLGGQVVEHFKDHAQRALHDLQDASGRRAEMTELREELQRHTTSNLLHAEEG